MPIDTLPPEPPLPRADSAPAVWQLWYQWRKLVQEIEHNAICARTADAQAAHVEAIRYAADRYYESLSLPQHHTHDAAYVTAMNSLAAAIAALASGVGNGTSEESVIGALFKTAVSAAVRPVGEAPAPAPTLPQPAA